MKKYFDHLITILLIGLLAYQVSRYFRLQPDLEKGTSAPLFTSELIDNSSFQLEELRGRYVLIDFWGSWCGPCRRQNPKLVKLYEEYHNQKYVDASGFDIVSVAIEPNTPAWHNAIKKDGLIWPYHMIDPSTGGEGFSGAIASQYKIQSVPSSYLLDPDGEIIKVNASYWQLKKALGERVLE